MIFTNIQFHEHIRFKGSFMAEKLTKSKKSS